MSGVIQLSQNAYQSELIRSNTVMLTSVLLGHKDIAQMVHSKLLASILVVGINAVRSFWWNAQKLKEAL